MWTRLGGQIAALRGADCKRGERTNGRCRVVVLKESHDRARKRICAMFAFALDARVIAIIVLASESTM